MIGMTLEELFSYYEKFSILTPQYQQKQNYNATTKKKLTHN